ncbi:bifunctional methylenetetrahydrofolate dehydrogenase/cyclohydrolase, mitochondrial isoform X1 [Wyeomyia smithii]|uniref:bifunctional methylenetetrahydrofolate dehydrogenase/cyclohydrolase, mitochondrial isoform X1 n=2 Tax=Wyeomyia smithii TaxID=174621 RepID=UPI0024681763|nr:bifunctional methylenetetrahydrofolate dehydrogenase/cyclohydrolase, mitochondrial isoform X1 [Wyeomyia smithii]XP_055538238.1 bifunctional methylenetetrahydrofolate dehydrogenase/cyclohydrolase, mitochondrial isoform X1 [Wyeomyia smithii]XP_055538240.1 bifunctional methylenetetrahydrofolate dehydrogenase/cyclohydrolase, mitochondrial isoform X1 [Wyeomyia smithii]XP_055538241.1 bifunctional methylenetetrahydrofolate dehydrogenase/cyclohydrolase, mitochondrial isoform X1 [Wyeomyia smithii]
MTPMAVFIVRFTSGRVHVCRAPLVTKVRQYCFWMISRSQNSEVEGSLTSLSQDYKTLDLFSKITDNSKFLKSIGSFQQTKYYNSLSTLGELGRTRTKMVHSRNNMQCQTGQNGADILACDRFIRTGTKDSSTEMATLIDGKQIAADIRSELREQVEEWMKLGHRAPQLTAILIGDDPASSTYVANKMKAAQDVGIQSKTVRYAADITEEQLLQYVEQLNQDDSVDGILVQLPVPEHINERKVCNSVSCDKDVDGFNERNVGRLCLDMNTLIPCTPLGVQELIKRCQIETFGKNAVVVGRSKNVGMPIAMLLHADGRNDTCAMDATVTMCHRFTPPEELKRFCRTADIIVTATGVPGLIKADMVKEGAAIIDVGITRVTDPVTGKNKLVGDVEFEAVRKVAGHITPVPGGVGPMTVAMLMKNTFIAAKNLANKRKQL